MGGRFGTPGAQFGIFIFLLSLTLYWQELEMVVVSLSSNYKLVLVEVYKCVVCYLSIPSDN